MKNLITTLFLLYSAAALSQSADYKIFKTSMNTKYAELGASYFKDNSVIYASSKKNDKDKSFRSDRRRTNKQLFLELYRGQLNEAGDIVQTELLTNEINNRYFESDITFTQDYKTVYFTWNNFYNTQTRQDSAKWQTLHIVKAGVDDKMNLRGIQTLPFSSVNYSVRSPALSADGKKLFFVSDMPGGYGGFDIYYVDILKDNTFGTPINMGVEINTDKHELYPFQGANGNLYFSSFGHEGLGSLDVFVSQAKNGSFESPAPLPEPINSKFDDFAFVINDSGNSGFITSNRKGGEGDVDIYKFLVIPKEIVCEQKFSGEILDKKSNIPLVNAQVELYQDGQLIDQKHLHGGHTFAFDLKCNSSYNLIIKRNFFIDEVRTITTSNETDKKIDQTILLEKYECLQYLSGHIEDSKTHKTLSNVFIELIKNDEIIDTLQVDSSFEFRSALDCKTDYYLVISRDDYITKRIALSGSQIPNEAINKIIQLDPVLEFVEKIGLRYIKTGPINFELNKFDITTEIEEELRNVVLLLNKYPTLKVQIKSHTDSRAPDTFNMNLSSNRAISIRDFLIKSGVNNRRLSAKGMGETELLNQCSNGVKCTDIEHELNRRTEFLILE